MPSLSGDKRSLPTNETHGHRNPKAPKVTAGAASTSNNSSEEIHHHNDEAAVTAANNAAAFAAAMERFNAARNENKIDKDASLQTQMQQFFQLQQAQMQNMSPNEVAQIVTQNMMLMMPMMPFMVPPPGTTTSENGEQTNEPSSPENDDTPKRKRGRPPKKEQPPRGKGDEKAIKQIPLWGYGMPLPLLPGFSGLPGSTTAGDVSANVGVTAGSEEQASQIREEIEADAAGRGRAGKGQAKKKSRGTGKPRGRPRTRPRPGEVLHRAKLANIAPNNLMYNLQLAVASQPPAGNGVPLKPAETGDEDDVHRLI